jgi:hypothetical protein
MGVSSPQPPSLRRSRRPAYFFFWRRSAPQRIVSDNSTLHNSVSFFILHLMLFVSLRSFCATDFAVKSNDWCAIGRRRADAQPLTATRCSLGWLRRGIGSRAL